MSGSAASSLHQEKRERNVIKKEAGPDRWKKKEDEGLKEDVKEGLRFSILRFVTPFRETRG